jgi:hypothetical protein
LEKEMTWIVTGRSESGDEYNDIFDHEPTEDELKKFVDYSDGWWTAGYESHQEMIAASDGGPGYNDSWINVEVEKK